MAQLVEDGLGVATLPRSAAQRLAAKLPLRVLVCDFALQALPIHLRWRDDPSSLPQRALIDSLLTHLRLSPLRAIKPARHRKDQ